MSEEKTLEKDSKRRDGLWYAELQPGEIYETTKQWKWADFDNRTELLEVPSEARIMFRSLQSYKKGKELALFYWLETKMSLCLVCSEKAGLIYIKHIPWDERHK